MVRSTTIKSKLSSMQAQVAVLIVVLVIGGALGVWALHNHNQSKASSASTATKTNVTSNKAQPMSAVSSSGQGSAATSGSNQSAGGGGSSGNGAAPIKPFGTFVSNHKPGQASPTDEVSVCNTTPGGSCSISFTQGGTAKTLPAKTADASGAVYWSWTPQSLGLTSGNWTVTATATLGQQSASTQDPTPLEVQ